MKGLYLVWMYTCMVPDFRVFIMRDISGKMTFVSGKLIRFLILTHLFETVVDFTFLLNVKLLDMLARSSLTLYLFQKALWKKKVFIQTRMQLFLFLSLSYILNRCSVLITIQEISVDYNTPCFFFFLFYFCGSVTKLCRLDTYIGCSVL